MDFYETQEFFQKMYPGKNISYDFDNNCLRKIEVIHTEGKPNTMHHLEFNQLKVTVEGNDPVYVPIMPHRATTPWTSVKSTLANHKDVWINPEELANRDIDELMSQTGLSESQINAKKIK